MSKQAMWLGALLVGWATTHVVAGDLSIGDPAPKLAVKEFVKGTSIAKLEKGKTYVVEFWATWCGPCRMTIPHMTELQKRYKEVTFLGVSIWENDTKDVKPFVEEMGANMDYRVAMDEVPAGGDGSDGAMAKAWMTAAGQDTIPIAFVVNGQGKIAWIGHPMAIDKPLAEIVAGKWNLSQFKRKYDLIRKLNELSARLAEAEKVGGSKEARKVIDEMMKVIDAATAEDPDLEGVIALGKYQMLAGKRGDAEKAQEYGKRLVDKVLKDNPDALTNLAWLIVGNDADAKPDAKLVKVGLDAARRADELSKGNDPNIADTLAKAYFVSGDAAKALECQKRAMKLAKGTPLEKDRGMQKRLEEYRKAVEKPAGPGGQR